MWCWTQITRVLLHRIRIISSHHNLKKTRNGFFPQSLCWGWVPADTSFSPQWYWFQTSSLQNCNGINYFCFNTNSVVICYSSHWKPMHLISQNMYYALPNAYVCIPFSLPGMPKPPLSFWNFQLIHEDSAQKLLPDPINQN